VLTQDFGDLELIIVDDGSTDQTPQVVAEISDPRLSYVRFQQNRGIGAGRNEGVTRARGELIGFADSDDIWLPGKLSYQVGGLERFPNVDIVFGDYLNINYINTTKQTGFDQTRGGISQVTTKQLEAGLWEVLTGLPQAMLNACFIHPPTILARRSALLRIGNFDRSLKRASEFELCWRGAIMGLSFAYSSRCLVERHKDAMSVTANVSGFALGYLRSLEACETVTRQAGRLELIRDIDQARHRVWRGLVREHALMGRRRDACDAFRQSLRYGISLTACSYLIAAVVGAKGSHALRKLKSAVRPAGG
jgi:GT2 family glycosyltransferase